MEPILVTGGTGTLGHHVVRRLRAARRDVRVLTRRTIKSDDIQYITGDLVSGAGVDAAVSGVTTIVHCAGGHSGDEVTTRNLLEAAKRAGRAHVVFISVVGADRVAIKSKLDRVMFSYFEMKRNAEELVVASGLPWTTLRATQFHDLVFMAVEKLAKLPVIPVPSGVSFQPIDTDEVAARFVELALGSPAGLAADIAGPRVYTAADLVREYLKASHRQRLVLPIPLPRTAIRALNGDANIAPRRAVGVKTWEQFLAERFPREASGPARSSAHA